MIGRYIGKRSRALGAASGTLAAVLLAATPALRAQAPDPARLADSLCREIDAAWFAGDTPRLDAARRLADRATLLFPKDGLLLHYKGYALYRMLMRNANALSPETRNAWIAEGMAAFAASAKLRPLAESHALRRALLAQTITDAGSAMAVQPQMAQAQADAQRLGKTNPRVWLLEGEGAFFTPPMWGGGPEAALGHLQKAEELFASDHPASGMPAWGRAEVEAWIGIVQQKLGHADLSRKAYQEALRLEPGFGWVNAVLLPALDAGKLPFPD